MTLQEIENFSIEEISKTNWHWFKYHFHTSQIAFKHPFSTNIIYCCYECEQRMDGYAKNFIEKLASYCDSEKNMEHYDQILQHIAELVVVSHLSRTLDSSWTFLEEPIKGTSKKNPEVSVSNDNITILVEVKSPKFFEYQKKRTKTGVQLPSRINNGFKDIIENIYGTNTALPRDNIVKDFLISADNKFKSFKNEDNRVLSILVIAWDDFIYEPISSLANDFTGLITENSYYKDTNGNTVKFENINYIILLRNMTHIVNATKDLPVGDGLKHPIDYGFRRESLPKPLITVNEHLNENILYDIFQCTKLEYLKDAAEYQPQDFVMWFER